MIEIANLPDKLKKCRTEHNISQAQIAKKMGCNKFHIIDLERKRSRITAQDLVGYCQALGLSPNELLEFCETDIKIIPELLQLISEKDKEEQERILRVIQALYL